MPEGDTIHYAANRIRGLLEGHVPDEILTPHPRFSRDFWPQRLAGRAVERVHAHGKHLLVDFEGGLSVHSHLRMTGSWRVVATPGHDRRTSRSAWLVLRRGAREAVQLNGPVLELMTTARTRCDPRLANLGPDILAESFDAERFLRKLREDDPTRPIGDALLDQRTLAGIGNLWKVEGCFEAGISPWRPLGEVGDDEAMAIVDACRPRMQRSARDGNQSRFKRIYGRAGRPCPRCGSAARIQARGQWDDNRLTFWCPVCQT